MISCVCTNLYYASLRGVYRDHGCTVQHESDLVVRVVCNSQFLQTQTQKE